MQIFWTLTIDCFLDILKEVGQSHDAITVDSSTEHILKSVWFRLARDYALCTNRNNMILQKS